MTPEKKQLHRAFMARMAGSGFEYGRNDCALFVVRYLVEVHGCDDFAAPFRGQYSNEEEAFDLIRDEGGLLGLCDRHLRQKPFNHAVRGDIAYKAFEDGTESVGVVDGSNVIAPTRHVKGAVGSTRLDKWDAVFEVIDE